MHNSPQQKIVANARAKRNWINKRHPKSLKFTRLPQSAPGEPPPRWVVWRGWGRHGLWLITSCGMSSEQCTATTTCRRGTIMCRPVLWYKHWILSKLSFNISFPHLQKYFWWDHYFVEARQCSIELRPSDQGRVPWGCAGWRLLKIVTRVWTPAGDGGAIIIGTCLEQRYHYHR